MARTVLTLTSALALSCAPATPPVAEAPATVFVMSRAPAPKPADTFDLPASSLPPRPRSEWNALRRDGQIEESVRKAAQAAVSRGLVPVLFVGRPGCEPCAALKRFRQDPRMQDALAGISVIEADLAVWGSSELGRMGMSPHTIPVFFVLDAEGIKTGRSITGAAWGDDIPENMAPPLSDFFRRER